MKVYGYCRVSTAEQAANGNSLEAQERRVAGYAMQNDWTIEECLVEAGVSGSVALAARPEGARLLALVRAGDVIVTPRMDRMFRSSADALVTLERLKKRGVALHMIDLGGDVLGNGIGKLVFTILAAVADNERERIRERITEVKRDMAARGLHSGGSRPFGYDIVSEDDGKVRRLVPNEGEQAVIEQMRQERAGGSTYRQIGKAHGKQAMAVRRILRRECQ